jgi:hypothetical protein
MKIRSSTSKFQHHRNLLLLAPLVSVAAEAVLLAEGDVVVGAEGQPEDRETARWGIWLAFDSNRAGSFDVWVVDADAGGEPTRLTDDPAYEQAPVWVPRAPGEDSAGPTPSPGP